MNKFLLRNLRNERRRIEKQIEKIDKEIDRVKNTKVLLKGTLDLNSLVKVEESDTILVDNDIKFDMNFNLKIERYGNEVVCTLNSKDFRFKGEQFIGKAVCAIDEKFDLATGMTIAQNRAIREVYNYIIGLFE